MQNYETVAGQYQDMNERQVAGGRPLINFQDLREQNLDINFNAGPQTPPGLGMLPSKRNEILSRYLLSNRCPSKHSL